MAIVEHPRYQPLTDDRDDHRPRSELAVVHDEAPATMRVDDLVSLLERVAPGDRIPLHVHQVNELITVHRGTVDITLGTEQRRMTGPFSVFVRAGTPHRCANSGEDVVELQAVFPASKVEVRYLERNAAPGTETLDPSHLLYDVFAGTVIEIVGGGDRGDVGEVVIGDRRAY